MIPTERCALWLVLLASPALFAGALDEWRWRHPLPQGNSLVTITFGNGKFVAAGPLGTVLTSSDGVKWNEQNSGTLESLAGITFAAGRFVAVGTSGTILTSPDGAVWTPRTSGVTTNLGGVGYGIWAGAPGMFVAAGAGGTLLTSPDGETWTPRTSGATVYLSGVAYGNGLFVVTGFYGQTGSGYGVLLTSPDGVVWTSQPIGPVPPLYDAEFGGGRFVVTGFGRYSFASTDGTNWTQGGGSEDLTRLIYANGKFTATSSQGISHSADGLVWNYIDSGYRSYVYDIAFGNGKYVAVGNQGWHMASSDGLYWTSSYRGLVETFNDAAYGNGVFVVVGGSGAILTGPEGPGAFVQRDGYTRDDLKGVVFANDRFVAVGGEGTIRESTNGINWSGFNLESEPRLQDVCFGDGRFVAVGGGGEVVIYDGQAAQLAFSGVTQGLFGVTHGNGVFVAVGSSGSILVSSNALNWADHRQTNLTTLLSVAFGNGTFVTADGFLRVATSSNGITWNTRSLPFALSPEKIIFGAGRFMIVTSDNEILSSEDGTEWSRHFTRSQEGFYGMACGDHTFLGVGEDGAIMQSADLRPRLRGRNLATGFEVTVTSGQTGGYRLQRRGRLLEPWAEVSGIAHDGVRTTVLDKNASGPVFFYRVVGP
jgi:hypothetical protein